MVLETISIEKHTIRINLTFEEYKLLEIEAGRRNLTEAGAAHAILKEYFEGIYRRMLKSEVKLKIVSLLNDLGQMHVTEIGRRLHHRGWSALKNHLDFLEDYGLVIQTPFGKAPIRFYKLNKENPKVQVLLEFMKAWET